MTTQGHVMTRRDAAEASKITPLLNTPQAAAVLGIGKRTLQELAAARKISFISFGRNVRYDLADLAAFAESNKLKAIGWKNRPARAASELAGNPTGSPL